MMSQQKHSKEIKAVSPRNKTSKLTFPVRVQIVPECKENPDVEKLGRAFISIAKNISEEKDKRWHSRMAA